MRTANRRPAGFTLIELLVVVSILAVLSALGAGVYFRIRAGQQVKATEETVSKLQTAFTQQWSAELDSARDAFSGKINGYTSQVDTIKTLCDQDQDRALAVWNYIWMRNAFPQTFVEASAACPNPHQLAGNTGAFAGQPPDTRRGTWLWLPANNTTKAQLIFPFPTPTPVANHAEENAVIVYKILTTKGTRGQTFNEESIGALSSLLPRDNTAAQKVFIDASGHPITFLRMSSGNGDVNSPPYIKGGGSNNDPLDPLGRLTTGTWTPANKSFLLPLTGRTTFNSQNWVPTLISRSTMDNWGSLATTPADLVPIPDGFIAGYKLRRQGARGDQ